MVTKTTRKVIETYGENRPFIVAMTASISEKDKQLCLDAGMDDYVSKPVDPEKLVVLFDQWKARIAGKH